MTRPLGLPRVEVAYDPGVGGFNGTGKPLTLGVCMWVPSARVCAFEWRREAIDVLASSDLNLSPGRMQPEPGVVMAQAMPFDGLHSLFSDSIPDGFGLRLMNHGLASLGIDPTSATPIERLAWVGNRGLGALVYRPVLESTSLALTDIDQAAQLAASAEASNFSDMPKEAIQASGSAQGARPKFWASLSLDGQRVMLGDNPRPAQGYTPVLLKFAPSRNDPSEPIFEAACLKLAADHDVLAAKGRLLQHKAGYCLAVERFDRDSAGHRVHMMSVAAMLNINFREPNFDYIQLIKLARQLGGSTQAERAYAQCCLNVALHLRDDHTKNFAFCMDAQGVWSLSPAYDLCPSEGIGYGREHTMAINGKGKDITRDDLMDLAAITGVSQSFAEGALDRARAAAANFTEVARSLGAPAKTTAAWQKRLDEVDRGLAVPGAKVKSKPSGPGTQKQTRRP